MLHIHSFPQTRGVRVVWACKELNIEYDYHVVNIYKGEHRTPEFGAFSPSKKVPVLVDDAVKDDLGESLTIAESGAIVTYLADKEGKLIPPVGSAQRAHFEEIMYFLVTELEQPLWTMAKHIFALPEDKRIPEMIAIAEWEFQKALKVFSEMLGDKDYVLGDEFSIADVVAGHVLSWAQGSEQEFPFDNINAYASRVLTRAALKEARKHEKALKEAISA